MERNTGTKVFTVKRKDMERLISAMSLKLSEGRLQEPGTNEIVLHRVVSENKSLGVGDRIGSAIQKQEALEGEQIIVGLLEGESIVSFDSLEYWARRNQSTPDDLTTGILMINRPGQIDPGLIDLYMKDADLQGLDGRTFRSVTSQYEADLESIRIILAVISMMIILILTICTSFINYINYYQRRNEFGILNAMGYSFKRIVNRVFIEIIIMNAAGFAAGVLLAVAAGTLLELAVYLPKGLHLLLVNPDYFVPAACIPVFGTIFSFLPVWKLLRTLDPVAVIEGVA